MAANRERETSSATAYKQSAVLPRRLPQTSRTPPNRCGVRRFQLWQSSYAERRDARPARAVKDPPPPAFSVIPIERRSTPPSALIFPLLQLWEHVTLHPKSVQRLSGFCRIPRRITSMDRRFDAFIKNYMMKDGKYISPRLRAAIALTDRLRSNASLQIEDHVPEFSQRARRLAGRTSLSSDFSAEIHDWGQALLDQFSKTSIARKTKPTAAMPTSWANRCGSIDCGFVRPTAAKPAAN